MESARLKDLACQGHEPIMGLELRCLADRGGCAPTVPGDSTVC
jgi:hypothetical protein